MKCIHKKNNGQSFARKAGVADCIEFKDGDATKMPLPTDSGIIVCNPPYGERISAPDLLGLYKMIGERLKHQFVDNDAWVLSYREECFEQIGLKPSLRTPLFNGSLECELRKYQIFSGRFNEMRDQGGDIKTAQERRMMADRRRFKQHREFKDRLEENPEERIRKSDRRSAEGSFERKGRKWRDEDTRGERRGERRFDRRDDRRSEKDFRSSDRDRKGGSWKDERSDRRTSIKKEGAERRGGNNPFARKGDKNKFNRK